MTIACDDSLLQMYVDGDMGAVERIIVEDHLTGCARCRRTVAAYKGLLWDLEHPAPEPAPPELDALSDSLMAAWEAAQAAPPPETWQKASLMWAYSIPGMQAAIGAAGWVGRSLPKAGLTGLGYLGRWLLRGGGRR